MDEQLYTNIKRNKSYRQFLQKKQGKGLLDLIDTNEAFGEKELIEAYCQELELILKTDNFFDVVDRIFALEEMQQLLYGQYPQIQGNHIPDIKDLFCQLSPLLLRSIQEANQINEDIYFNWMAAIRVALEDELYRWKDYILENSIGPT